MAKWRIALGKAVRLSFSHSIVLRNSAFLSDPCMHQWTPRARRASFRSRVEGESRPEVTRQLVTATLSLKIHVALICLGIFIAYIQYSRVCCFVVVRCTKCAMPARRRRRQAQDQCNLPDARLPLRCRAVALRPSASAARPVLNSLFMLAVRPGPGAYANDAAQHRIRWLSIIFVHRRSTFGAHAHRMVDVARIRLTSAASCRLRAYRLFTEN